MTAGPVRLRADNFTPPTRTPWGGRRIREHYKRELGLAPGDPVVGESWEISVDPRFPSRTVSGERLADLVAASPSAWLGACDAHRHGGQLALLVKLLDAADNLSVQVHPADGAPTLRPDESGKPEAWIVLDAAPGAGLYLGFRDGVRPEEVAECIGRGGALDALMNFVPVRPDDAFVIDAGTPHAIGAGVTVCEPQRVVPGKIGVTYRFWDWGRRYDRKGCLDPAGEERPLHLGASLAVTDWSCTGEALVARCRAAPTVIANGPARRTEVVRSAWLVTERWAGAGTLALEPVERLWAITCVSGEAQIAAAPGRVALAMGESAVVPACAGALDVGLHEAIVLATRLGS